MEAAFVGGGAGGQEARMQPLLFWPVCSCTCRHGQGTEACLMNHVRPGGLWPISCRCSLSLCRESPRVLLFGYNCISWCVPLCVCVHIHTPRALLCVCGI